MTANETEVEAFTCTNVNGTPGFEMREIIENFVLRGDTASVPRHALNAYEQTSVRF